MQHHAREGVSLQSLCQKRHGRVRTFRVSNLGDGEKERCATTSPTTLKEQKISTMAMFISSPAERFVVSTPARRYRDMECPPVFIVPLKLHNAAKGYECYMSCAVTGNPKPRITWYRNHVSLNTDTNYYISNTCGVCSLLILRVGPKDMGEYTIAAENTQGRAECSTVLSVRGENTQPFQFHPRMRHKRTDGNNLSSPNRVKMPMSAEGGQGAGPRVRPDGRWC